MTAERRCSIDDTLERAIVAAKQSHLPDSPNASELLSSLPDQAIAGATWPTPGRKGRWVLREVGPVVAKYATAVALVVVSGLFLLSTPTQSALAQVIANAKGNRLVCCQLETLAKVKMKVHADREAEYVDARSKETVFFDLVAPRLRIERVERTLNDTVDSQWTIIQDNLTNRVLITSSQKLAVTEKDTKDADQLKGIALFRESGGEGKVARIFHTSDKGVKPFLHKNSQRTLLGILDHLQTQSDIVPVSDEVDGQPADKFVFEDGDQIITLWSDSQSHLPVRIEEQRRNPHAKAKWYKWTYSDFQWKHDGVDLEQLFSTEPPVGYDVEDHIAAP